ncbi:MAG TPA: hypothetical protein VM802_18260 [Chitinophaga sp.]|uniref:hypothetical protein n=1 Tax=Chitinophaga sp. TaxID=1869181 RepID=UPI002B917654|nr:hypothetical protein [Chitinophaga sp.]HVI46829.1 hypothetical protein [Chitinophaga sp.]
MFKFFLCITLLSCLTALSASAKKDSHEWEFPDGSVWIIDTEYTIGLDGIPHGSSHIIVIDGNGNSLSWDVVFSARVVKGVDERANNLLLKFPDIAPALIDRIYQLQASLVISTRNRFVQPGMLLRS